MSEAVAAKLVRKTAHGGRAVAGPERPAWFADLSSREREVLRHLVEGKSNHEIAAVMFIAEQTVRNHISEIYSKIGENDRSRIVREYRALFQD